MKITLFRKALVLLLAIGGLTMAAQAQTTESAQPRTEQQGRKTTPEARVEKLAAELNLSADQKAKFLQLEKEKAGKLPRPQKDATAEQRAQFKEARKAHRQAQRALLTPEQAVKFDAMKDHKGKKGGGNCVGKNKVKKA